MKRIILLFAVFIIAGSLSAQVRIKQSINTGWLFHKGQLPGYPEKQVADSVWQPVNLPHTWNTDDVSDEKPGYYRGIGWYHKTLFIPAAWKGKTLLLHFEGANQVATVYVNGHKAAQHTGGYTAFDCFISDKLNYTSDSLTAVQIDVQLDNAHNENIPPLDADFTFYGGIYRDVYLVALDPTHFSTDNGADGVRISTKVSAEQATVTITADVSRSTDNKEKLVLISDVFDRAGKKMNSVGSVLTTENINQQINIKQPHLWSPDDAYLYHVVTRIETAKSGKVLDELTEPLGLRWFSFSASEGFFLNGKHLKLIGANRHQDYMGIGNALPDALHVRDMELLKNMGANFIRVAHYPQDPAVMEACDRLGILASVEIPIVNRITESREFTDNCLQMQREMIAQNADHPSVIIWAYMNEVLISPRYKDGSEEQKAYYGHVVKLAQSIDSLSHAEDPGRYTMIPCHGDFDRYYNTGLAKVPQIVGWNLYYGWYAKDFNGLDAFLARHHQLLPDKPMIITEYGADADQRLRTFAPQRFDKTIDYQLLYHQYYLKVIRKLPFVAGAAMWNLVDFNAEKRQEATPHFNTKGMLTTVRVPKETYYFYQANLSQKPVIHIGANEWRMRGGTADAHGQCNQPVTVYSNCAMVSLYLNNSLLGTKAPVDGMAVFTVPFINGANRLQATGKSTNGLIEDDTQVDFDMLPQDLHSTTRPFNGINVNLGDERYYSDTLLHQLWVPEQPYYKGGWGYIGGEAYKAPGNLPYGSGRDILGTELDPVYQTQRVGLSDFKLDVTDGVYEVTLHFAELTSATQDKPLLYDLGRKAQATEAVQREFDVTINGGAFLDHIGSDNYLTAYRAYAAKTTVTVKNGQGIDIHFTAQKGQPVLNGLQVMRIY